MKIIQKTADVLIVKTEMVLFALSVAGSLLFASLAVYSFVTQGNTVRDDVFIGQTGAAVVFLLTALVFFNIVEFQFDRKRRLVIWKKRTLFTNRSGTLDFDTIKAIKIQSLHDVDNVRSGRLTIILNTGILPLTKAYSGNTSQLTRIAEILNHWVFSTNLDLVKESIKTALAESNRTEAAITLRRAYPLSMAEARDILDNPEKLDALPPSAQTKERDLHSGDKELVLGLIALILLVCGPIALILGLYGCFKGIGTASWTQTAAVVQTSRLHRLRAGKDEYLRLSYLYKVNGRAYTSVVFYMAPLVNKERGYPISGKFYLKRSEVINMRDYRPGKAIYVYYNPDDPKSAVVIPGVSGVSWAFVTAGTVLILIYLYLARRDLRAGKKG